MFYQKASYNRVFGCRGMRRTTIKKHGEKGRISSKEKNKVGYI
jgi:hypothetical protein